MNYIEYLQLMLDAALDIKAGNFDKEYGICTNLQDKVHSQTKGAEYYDSWRILRRAFYTWPKFSGDVNFPIDDPHEIETPCNVYARSHKWIGEYGALRFELLDHVIDCLKKEIESATRTA